MIKHSGLGLMLAFVISALVSNAQTLGEVERAIQRQ